MTKGSLCYLFMENVCKLLGMKKLSATVHHPQCKGVMEGLNHTLKMMLQIPEAKFGTEWDTYLPGAL